MQPSFSYKQPSLRACSLRRDTENRTLSCKVGTVALRDRRRAFA
jgi:hypothetical protein